MSDINKAIGERLKWAREKANLKQNAIANWLGIHNSTLAKYESGQREIDNQTLVSLCEKYNIRLEWVMTGEGDISPTGSNAQSSHITIDEDPDIQFILRTRRELSPKAFEQWMKAAKKMKQAFEDEEEE